MPHPKYLRSALWIAASSILLLFLLQANARVAASETDGRESSTAVGVHPSNWLVQMLRVLLDDVDWRAIATARDEVAKVIRGMDRVISAFKSSMKQAGGDQRQDSSSAFDYKRLFSSGGSNSRWWTSASSPSKVFGQAEAADSTSVRGMLERIACFVGYMRLLNHSNEALAELDASKVVSNLFAADKRNSSGFFSNLFG